MQTIDLAGAAIVAGYRAAEEGRPPKASEDRECVKLVTANERQIGEIVSAWSRGYQRRCEEFRNADR